MSDWKPDLKYLDFLLDKAITQGHDVDEEFMGTEERTYSMRQMIDEMKQGTDVGKAMYESMVELDKQNPIYQQEYQEYLKRNP